MGTTILGRVSLILLSVLAPAAAWAQPIGAFRWQLQPYCNVVTVNVSQNGTVQPGRHR